MESCPLAPQPADFNPCLCVLAHVQMDPKVVFKELNNETLHEWDYACYSPKGGMSEPRVTIATVVAGLPRAYHAALLENRLQYAHAHGYR
jgi:hypothetical protein